MHVFAAQPSETEEAIPCALQVASRHNGACFPAEAHKDEICRYLMEGRYE